jgi:hypothetical protein
MKVTHSCYLKICQCSLCSVGGNICSTKPLFAVVVCIVVIGRVVSLRSLDIDLIILAALISSSSSAYRAKK